MSNILINHTIKSSFISFLAEYRKWEGSKGHFMGIKISDLLDPPVGLFGPGTLTAFMNISHYASENIAINLPDFVF